MKNNQKSSFLNYEADAWFVRNSAVIKNYNLNDDKVIDLFDNYNYLFS